MRKQHWLLFTAVLALLVGLAQANVSAEGKNGVIDQGRNVYMVDSSKGDLNNLLPGEEVEKIKRLQTESQASGLISPISPDDQAALATFGDRLGFMNIQDGTFIPLDRRVLSGRFVPIISLLGLTPWGWRDDRTLVGVGVEIVDPKRGELNPALVTIDRLTGDVDGIALSSDLLKQMPVSLAPNGSQLLLLDLPELDDASQGVVKAQVSWSHIAPPTANALPAALQQQAEAFAADSAYGRRLLALRPLLAPGDNDDEMVAAAKNTRLMLYNIADGATRELRSFAPGLMSMGFAWSQDGARLAASFLGAFDYSAEPTLRERPPLDGALLSEQIYRDVTGNLPPAENPLLQRNTVEIFDLNGGGDKT
ncbi:MAG: hypothetical protein M3R61_14775, partial [Chloroflexota bacterium]|nr:hypothetical protein [Chloroflexota bacterium]